MPQLHQPRALLHLLLALCVATACTTPTATTPDATAGADAAPDVLADVAAPDVAAVDVADVADAVDVAADVSVAGLVVQSSEATLIPPPLTVGFSATKDGVDMSAECSWTVGPPSVCVLADAGHVRKVGDGTCVVTCALASGEKASKELVAKAQTVIYVAGGFQSSDNILKVSRFRVSDGKWDSDVATMPETRVQPALGIWAGQLFVIGGRDVQPVVPLGAKPAPKASKADCPEVSYNGGTDFGCRAIRVLNLSDGTWSIAGSLPKAWTVRSPIQVGQYVFGPGGENAYDATSQFLRYDMATKAWTDLTSFLPEPAPNLGPEAHFTLAPWKGGFVAYGADTKTEPWEVDATGTIWKKVAMPAMGNVTPPLQVLGALQTDMANLFVLDTGTVGSLDTLPGGCAYDVAGAPTAYHCAIAQLSGGSWSLVPTPVNFIGMGYFNSLSTAVGLFLFADGTCDAQGTNVDPALRLAQFGGPLTAIPPPEPCRTSAAYAATIQ